jgi:hypothetical protein
MRLLNLILIYIFNAIVLATIFWLLISRFALGITFRINFFFSICEGVKDNLILILTSNANQLNNLLFINHFDLLWTHNEQFHFISCLGYFMNNFIKCQIYDCK